MNRTKIKLAIYHLNEAMKALTGIDRSTMRLIDKLVFDYSGNYPFKMISDLIVVLNEISSYEDLDNIEVNGD